MFTRYLSSAAAGLAVTTSLLWVMQYLVEVAEPVETSIDDWRFLEWVHVREDSVVETLQKKPDPIPGPTETPDPRPPIDPSGPLTPVGYTSPPVTPTGPDLNGGIAEFVDGALVNLVNVQPEYPPAAIGKGIEGYVIVRFDVTVAGTVENVSIVEASHRVFHKAALRAAQRSRYKPQVVDGVPQPASGLQKLFRFEMENE